MEGDKIEIEKSEVRPTVSLVRDTDNGGLKLAVKLEVSIDGIDEDQKHQYVEKAHHHCPYSKAVKDSIDVEIVVI